MSLNLKPRPPKAWPQKDIDLTNAFERWIKNNFPLLGGLFEKGGNPNSYYKNDLVNDWFKAFKAGFEMASENQINLKEVADAEFAKGYETAKQEMAKEQVLNPLDQAKLELINAKIEVEKAKLERVKKASNPLVLPSEAVEAGI